MALHHGVDEALTVVEPAPHAMAAGEDVAPSRPALTAGAAVAAFPLGGIGTGNVSIGARGELRDWELFNSPGRGNTLPYSFFCIRAAPEGSEPVTRVLESRLRPPHGERPFGYLPGDTATFPRLDDSSMRGEYPFVWIKFADGSLPVDVSLEAFTPLVPLDASASGVPAAILTYQIGNGTDVDVEVTVAGSLTNPVGFTGYGDLPGVPKFDGDRHNSPRDDGLLRGLWMTSTLPPHHLRHGTMALATTMADVTIKPDWRFDLGGGGRHFWHDLHEDGRLQPIDAATETGGRRDLLQLFTLRVGSVAASATLAPGERRDFRFVLTWHFPNRPKAWLGFPRLAGEGPASDETTRNHYATWLQDAWDVVRYVTEEWGRLEASSRAFHHALHRGTLPDVIVDAAASNIAVLRSTTCIRLADGTLIGWEGALDDMGSCLGSCTHVWASAQTVAHLFPELERTMRRVEFGLETDPDGRMNFRTNRVFGGPALWETFSDEGVREVLRQPAVDGQLGAVIRLHREWKMSGDRRFLADLWPAAVRALEHAFARWDLDGDCVIEAAHHTTYDIEFCTATSYANSIFFAALLAAAEMADHLGEHSRAGRYRDAARRGSEKVDRRLWNGEYYEQDPRGVDDAPYQFGSGCLSDQLVGQLHAHLAGLGYVLPRDHVKQAIESVFANNFRADLYGHVHDGRALALDDEGGLLLCTWPRGGRPAEPFHYSDEVWTGVEYQVAAQLIYEGLLDEALTIVRAVRSRYDGYRRNPWNEVEAGHHYVRAMSSWALVLAWSGFHHDAVEAALSFAPAHPEVGVRCFFAAGSGWGTFVHDDDRALVQLAGGTLRVARVCVPALGRAVVRASINDDDLPVDVDVTGSVVSVSLDPVTMTPGDVLALDLSWDTVAA